MSKGSKSLQLSLNEFIPRLGKSKTSVSKVAYSKARRKLKHTAFIELNKEAVIKTMYEDGDYQTWHGHRVLAVDGSKIILPDNKDTIAEFGTWHYWAQQKDKDISGTRTMALASTLYDVLNGVCIDASLERCDAHEVSIAKEHLRYAEDNDLVIYDRGYFSFRMMAIATQAKGDFLIRARGRRSFRVSDEMLKGYGPDDIVVEIKPSKNRVTAVRAEGLPTRLTVRFVRVKLKTGEYEVLATSLTDQKKYPAKYFKDLYYLRWGIETFYGRIKGRLGLENFSGYSPEAIRQDFFVTIFLTGAESILTLDAEEQLKKKSKSIKPKKVNKAVSFNAIKYRAFELFYSNEPEAEVLQQLTSLFVTSPTTVRKDRNPARFENSSRQVLNFWKRKRKTVF